MSGVRALMLRLLRNMMLRPRRNFVPLLLVATLTACAPVLRAGGPPTTEARLDADAIRLSDAQRLPLRAWLPAGAPVAVVVAVHGFNDYSNAFDAPGTALAARGIAVYAFDQRGFGGAPDHGYWAGTASMVADLTTVTRLVGARYPGKPLFLLGESMGGALVMVAMSGAAAPPVDGVILAAPAVWTRDSMGPLQSGLLWLASHTMPWLTLTGRGLHIQASDNIAMLRALGRDPLVITETRVDAIHGLADLMDAAAAAAPRLRVPALVLYGDHDQVVPADPTYRMMASLPKNPAPPVKAIYADGYHMLLRDLQAAVVVTDIAAWIVHPDRPLPSGADRRASQLLESRPAIG